MTVLRYQPRHAHYARGQAKSDSQRGGWCAVLVALSFVLPFACAAAEEAAPQITEETPFVRSPSVVVDTMLRMAGVRATDFLIDLGSGDGRIVITAAQEFGTRGFGVDYDPRLVKLATDNARAAGVEDRVTFVQQDLFKTDLRQASVVTMYLLEEYNLALRPKLFALRPGTRIVSHDFDMGDWEPDAKVKIAVPDKPVGREKASTIFFWMVPAHIEGSWRTRVPAAKGWTDMLLRFEQHYQKISGEALINGARLPLERASLSGEIVSFRVQQGKRTIRFSGQVGSGHIAGQVAVSGGRTYRWRALRDEKG
jgi:hypothetical protein